jgi:hypothetical protein
MGGVARGPVDVIWAVGREPALEIAVNLQSARALALEMPQWLLLRASKVFE